MLQKHGFVVLKVPIDLDPVPREIQGRSCISGTTGLFFGADGASNKNRENGEEEKEERWRRRRRRRKRRRRMEEGEAEKENLDSTNSASQWCLYHCQNLKFVS